MGIGVGVSVLSVFNNNDNDEKDNGGDRGSKVSSTRAPDLVANLTLRTRKRLFGENPRAKTRNDVRVAGDTTRRDG